MEALSARSDKQVAAEKGCITVCGFTERFVRWPAVPRPQANDGIHDMGVVLLSQARGERPMDRDGAHLPPREHAMGAMPRQVCTALNTCSRLA